MYVANLHPQHRDTAILFMNAGKHVLCEKPIALNAAHARDMIEAAKQNVRCKRKCVANISTDRETGVFVSHIRCRRCCMPPMAILRGQAAIVAGSLGCRESFWQKGTGTACSRPTRLQGPWRPQAASARCGAAAGKPRWPQ